MGHRLVKSAYVILFCTLASLASSGSALSGNAVILICTKDQECTVQTARIFFTVEVQNELPYLCLIEGQQKSVQALELKGEDEIVKIECKR